jgi:RNase P subunit RPR2
MQCTGLGIGVSSSTAPMPIVPPRWASAAALFCGMRDNDACSELVKFLMLGSCTRVTPVSRMYDQLSVPTLQHFGRRNLLHPRPSSDSFCGHCRLGLAPRAPCRRFCRRSRQHSSVQETCPSCTFQKRYIITDESNEAQSQPDSQK